MKEAYKIDPGDDSIRFNTVAMAPYDSNGGQGQLQQLLSWTTQLPLWERRSDLHGKFLRCAVNLDHPELLRRNEDGSYEGFYWEIFSALKTR